ncbi:unnamed protein product [Sphagnum troendelagicum]
MTLLLGPPCSGKSTLLRALAGKLDKNLGRSGVITYNGHTMKEFVPQRTSAYISQMDNHIGELTVRETLDFAARCQGVGYKYGMHASDDQSNLNCLQRFHLREKQQNIHPDPDIDAFMKATAVQGKKHSLTTDYIMKVLGLEFCADTLVGNDMLRGISGGQKKRVTTGEMVVGPKKTLFMDEISTGLDSITTFQIVKCMRNFVHLLEGTVLMALLQPVPETFELFDDILLLAEGQVVFLGPREKIFNFFEGLGFKLPPRKGIADFLQEVTSKKEQEKYWTDESKTYEYIPVARMVKKFQESEVGQEITNYLATPYNRASSHQYALVTTNFALSKWELLKACTEREWLLIKRNKFIYIFRTCQVGVVACITATLYLRTWLHPVDHESGDIYLSSFFFALVHMMLNGFSEMSITIAGLPVFYKQRDSLFYPSWAFSIPSWILRLPYSMVEGVIWSCIVYYSIGLAPEPGRFFRYMLLLSLMHHMSIGLFRFLGAFGRSMVIANTMGAFTILITFLLGGFVIAKEYIHPWWIWGFWIMPLSYAQNAISANEFLAPRWRKLDANTGEPLYLSILRGRGLSTNGYWYWIGVGVLTGYTILFNIFVTLALGFLEPAAGQQVKHLAAHTSINMEDLQGCQDQGWAQQKGMILPFQPLTLSFNNICYYVDMPHEMKVQGITTNRLQLLRNVSGVFKPGRLTALMGVSGAGKTTLMDVLAGRKTGGYIEGEIKISGYPKVQDTFARISGYVEQTDIHSPQVTVHESLMFSSWLRLPRQVDKATHSIFVEEVMELVELSSLRHALVGLPGSSGLSVEQRKRLTIAVELVANPSIIFMDEPTSGLDARAAAIVMRTVQNTVKTGRTVVCTIHQPSIDIFEAFDELLLMKPGGQLIYAGPLGQDSKLLVEYFLAIDGIPPINDGYNPATWVLEVTTPAAELQIGKDFADVYHDSELFLENEYLIKQSSIPAPGTFDLEFASRYPQSPSTQLMICLWKQNITYWRSPYYNVVRFFSSFVYGLIFGSIFWGLGSQRKTQIEVFNVMGALYAGTMLLGVQNASTVQPVVAVERTVFYREHAASMYSPLPYALAQGLVELPYILIQSLLYGTITYLMIQYEMSTAKFLWYLLFMFLTFTYYTMYGIMAVGLTSSQMLAAVMATIFYSLWNLFSGFLIPFPEMPIWWSWYYWINPVQWTINGLASSQLGDVTTTMVAPGFGTISVKDYIQQYFGYHHDRLGICATVLVSFGCVFWFIFALSIKYINFQRR